MIGRAAHSLVLGLLTLAACSGADSAPPAFAQSAAAEVLYLVHQEVRAIRVDGTGVRTLGRAGDDRHRTGGPRFLPDGRAAVMADELGQIFPHVAPNGGGVWTPIMPMNETINDALCGITMQGASRLVFTTTPFLPTQTTVRLADVDANLVRAVTTEYSGVLAQPAPYDDGRVLVVRVIAGDSTIGILDLLHGGAFESIATVSAPYFAMSPARLPDGRVAFLRIDSRDDFENDPIGEIFVIGRDRGQPMPTGLDHVAALVVAGDRVVYEWASPQTLFTDLMASDLSGARSTNITNTPYVSEHLGWSD